MIRSAVAVLALIALSGLALPAIPAEAQQEVRTHEVTRGETLWGIAERYYENGRLWTRIFEANRDRMDDPDDLDVGLVLTIPSGEGAEVGGVTVVPPAEEEVMEEEPAAPPQEAPRRPRSRTVFWPDTANPTLVADIGPMLSAVSPDVMYSTPWLVPFGEEPEHTGRVVGFAGSGGADFKRASTRPHDRMLVTFDGPAPAVGSLLQVFRVDHDIEEVGRVTIPTGVLRVTDIQPAGVTAEVEKLYDRMALGDLVGPLPGYPLSPGQRAASVTGGPTAGILGFAKPRALYSIGDIVFLDRGSEDGVSIGDEYVVVVGASEGWTGDVEGRLQVVHLHPGHSSARITGEKAPVFQRGLEVRLARKMR